MKGLELAESYYLACGVPMIQEKFAPYADRIAAGLVGDGSECLGFDDEISQDHDWGPGFCLWLVEEDFQAIGNALNDALSKLPPTFGGYGPRQTSEWGAGRVGAFEISRFYCNFIGVNCIPTDLNQWLFIPEDFLSACTNGKVFHDPLGEFTRWRNTLLAFYPEDVRLKKIASRCMTTAQSGQYNLKRCVQRKEYFAAQYAETKFCADVISLIFLLNKRYTPFYKWMHRALKSLPLLGEFVHVRITDIVISNDYEEKISIVENICISIIDELRKQGLSDAESSFLLDHGPQIQSKIQDKQLRERNVWVG
ncbi:MAG: hypothetical protein CO171_08110 [Syntrophobacterales bacterium CG_4_9_14_3_um_filter_49_8]|nr:MAG: hypothetical protein CO171_08110 [Syntrophobacterales bacterium CG_4_9_14_3_um_filter_49_8]